MRSVRFDDSTEKRLQEAARITGEPVSKIIRAAIEEHCDRLLGQRLDHRLADVIGSIDSGGANSRQSGKAFTEILLSRQRRQP
jgi:predicted DNA-binding protein